MNKNYVAITDLDLSNARIFGFDDCSLGIAGSDIVVSDCFGRVAVKYPFDLNARYMHVRGLPEGISIGEYGNLEYWEVDHDDEDYFGEEEQSEETLKSYSYVQAMNFTLVIKHTN